MAQRREKAPPAALSTLGRIVRTISTWLGYLAGLLLFVMMVYVTVDVILRYFFGRPSAVVDEVSAYLLVGIVFLGAAVTQRDHRHTHVELIVARLPTRLRYWIQLATYAIGFVAVVIFAWQSLELARASFVGNRLANTLLRTPLWMPQAVIVIGLVIFALQMLMQFLLILVSGQAEPVDEGESLGVIGE